MIDFLDLFSYLGISGRWKNVTKLFTNVMNILWILHLTINEIWKCHLNIYSLQFRGFLLVSWNHFFFLRFQIFLWLWKVWRPVHCACSTSRVQCRRCPQLFLCRVPGFGFFTHLFLLQISLISVYMSLIQEAFLDPSLESSHPILFHFSL